MFPKVVNVGDTSKSHKTKVDKAMKTHENDPYFIKKAAKASDMLKKCVLPPGFEKTVID